MPVVQANGIQIHYEIGGEGRPVLFISGTGGDLRNRPGVFDGPLAAAFEVLAYDQRGLGQTEAPDTDYVMADYADDAAGLLEVLGWDRVPVMGVSFGGMVAQELAIRHPDRVSALVLACTSSGGEGGASYPLHELEALLYTDPAAAGAHFGDDAVKAAMEADLNECGEPELVDEGPETAPSKRMMKHRSGYLKTSDGPNILADLGLAAIRGSCPHFDSWLTKIATFAP